MAPKVAIISSLKFGDKTSLFVNFLVSKNCFFLIKSIFGWVLSKFFGAVFNSSPSKDPKNFLKVSSAIISLKSEASNSNSLRIRNKSSLLGS